MVNQTGHTHSNSSSHTGKLRSEADVMKAPHGLWPGPDTGSYVLFDRHGRRIGTIRKARGEPDFGRGAPALLLRRDPVCMSALGTAPPGLRTMVIEQQEMEASDT